MKKIIVLIFLLALTEESCAYLDPASGNAIVCLIISIFGALVFYLKNLFYKFLGVLVGKPIKKTSKEKIVIFSEGKNYYFTYIPIIEELIKRKVHFSYLTMDIEDPCLLIDNEFMYSKYIGTGNKAYAKISSYSTEVMISTTPNIGCKDFPIKRSKKIIKLIHVWHSVCDTSFYNLGALDFYDVAITVGPWVEKSIRNIEKIRNIPHKEVFSLGVPYLDKMKNELEINPTYKNILKEDKTILVAPSWGDKNCLRYYGIDFIKELSDKDYIIIVRPHPQSIKVEYDYIEMIQEELREYNNVLFDFDTDGLKTMAKSSILISDKSSMRFDYSILFERPVLTLDIPQKYLKIYESYLMEDHFEDKFADKLGIRLTLSKKYEIVAAVSKLFDFNSENIKNNNRELISNFGNSASSIVHYLETVISK